MAKPVLIIIGVALIGAGIWTTTSSASPVIWIGGFLVGASLIWRGLASD